MARGTRRGRREDATLSKITGFLGRTTEAPLRASPVETPLRMSVACSEEMSMRAAVASPHKIEVRGEKTVRSGGPTLLTDYFPVRRSCRRTKRLVDEERARALEARLRDFSDPGLAVRYFGSKGRGVVATRRFARGDMVVEYAGELISADQARAREILYSAQPATGCYMYYFSHRTQQLCVDATAESDRLGRLVNHSRQGNLVTRVVEVEGIPRLVLLAKEDIEMEQELTYDYGDRSKEALRHHPWLAT